MVREEAVSVALGYTSIACWLGAQFPQILVNWRRQSVDGLSLPFLINWMFGDTTNLIGCLLTDQLPFQTYVAVYFVLVDFSLVTQYFYYDAAKDAKALSALRQRSASRQRRLSSSLILPLPSSSSLPAQQHHPYTLPRASLVRSRSASSYSRDPQLRAALANVSLAAAEAEARHAGEQQQPPWRRMTLGGASARRRAGSLEGLPESVVADSHAQYREWAATAAAAQRQQPRPGDTDDDDDDANGEEAGTYPESPSVMISSFYSEDGGGQAAAGRNSKRVSWSAEGSSGGGGNGGRRRRRRLSYDWREEQPSTAATATASDSRGRQLARPAASSPTAAAAAPETFAVVEEPLLLQAAQADTRPLKRRTSTTSTVSAAASRRSAGIVFLGVFALFGLSTTMTRGRGDGAAAAGGRGEVLTAAQRPLPPPPSSSSSSSIPLPYDVLNLNLSPTFDHASAAVLATATSSFPVERQQQHAHDDIVVLSAGSDATKQLIGRISAWTCTTLYITSRLPQIWKNFARKSVEGLSIYLFIFAFLGNLFYVLSILSNPRMDLPAPQAAMYLRASVPYLLGSGGTLMFDVTIVLQSFVYRSRSPRSSRSRSSSSLFGTKRRGRRKSQSMVSAMEEGEGGEEERAALLGSVGGRVEGGG